MEGAPEPESPPGASFADLSPPLLGRIFVLMGRPSQIGPVVTLVCRSWREAFYSEPGLWTMLKVPAVLAAYCLFAEWPEQQLAAWFIAQRALLRRVHSLVSAVECTDGDRLGLALQRAGLPWSPADLLSELPTTLTSLSFCSWSDSLPPSLLAGFPNLHSLSLNSDVFDGSRFWAPAMLESICSMRQLTELSIDAHHPPPELLAALAGQLPQLRRLSVRSRKPLQHAEQLASCTGLQNLRLVEVDAQEGSLQPPLPAQLPSLQYYEVRREFLTSNWQVPGGLLGAAAFKQTAPGSATLELWGIVQLSSLPALLAAVTPPASAHMHCLKLGAWRQLPPQAAAVPAGSAAARQLAQLEELHLYGDERSSDAIPLLEAVLPHAALQLTHLNVCGGLGPRLPPCVVQLRGLRRLGLSYNELDDLPGGPYLETLEHLDLTHNQILSLPPALSAATALTCLLVSANYGLALRYADVDILYGLPRLKELHACKTNTHPDAFEYLRWESHFYTCCESW